MIDLDHGGTLDAEEMMKMMDMLGMMAMEDEVKELIEQIDSSGEGEVSFADFVVATNKKVSVDYSPKEVVEAFDFFSKSFHRESGIVRETDLKEILTKFGPVPLNEEFADKILAELPKKPKKGVKDFGYRSYVNSTMC